MYKILATRLDSAQYDVVFECENQVFYSNRVWLSRLSPHLEAMLEEESIDRFRFEALQLDASEGELRFLCALADPECHDYDGFAFHDMLRACHIFGVSHEHLLRLGLLHREDAVEHVVNVYGRNLVRDLERWVVDSPDIVMKMMVVLAENGRHEVLKALDSIEKRRAELQEALNERRDKSGDLKRQLDSIKTLNYHALYVAAAKNRSKFSRPFILDMFERYWKTIALDSENWYLGGDLNERRLSKVDLDPLISLCDVDSDCVRVGLNRVEMHFYRDHYDDSCLVDESEWTVSWGDFIMRHLTAEQLERLCEHGVGFSLDAEQIPTYLMSFWGFSNEDVISGCQMFLSRSGSHEYARQIFDSITGVEELELKDFEVILNSKIGDGVQYVIDYLKEYEDTEDRVGLIALSRSSDPRAVEYVGSQLRYVDWNLNILISLFCSDKDQALTVIEEQLSYFKSEWDRSEYPSEELLMLELACLFEVFEFLGKSGSDRGVRIALRGFVGVFDYYGFEPKAWVGGAFSEWDLSLGDEELVTKVLACFRENFSVADRASTWVLPALVGVENSARVAEVLTMEKGCLISSPSRKFARLGYVLPHLDSLDKDSLYFQLIESCFEHVKSGEELTSFVAFVLEPALREDNEVSRELGWRFMEALSSSEHIGSLDNIQRLELFSLLLSAKTEREKGIQELFFEAVFLSNVDPHLNREFVQLCIEDGREESLAFAGRALEKALGRAQLALSDYELIEGMYRSKADCAEELVCHFGQFLSDMFSIHGECMRMEAHQRIRILLGEMGQGVDSSGAIIRDQLNMELLARELQTGNELNESVCAELLDVLSKDIQALRYRVVWRLVFQKLKQLQEGHVEAYSSQAQLYADLSELNLDLQEPEEVTHFKSLFPSYQLRLMFNVFMRGEYGLFDLYFMTLPDRFDPNGQDFYLSKEFVIRILRPDLSGEKRSEDFYLNVLSEKGCLVFGERKSYFLMRSPYNSMKDFPYFLCHKDYGYYPVLPLSDSDSLRERMLKYEDLNFGKAPTSKCVYPDGRVYYLSNDYMRECGDFSDFKTEFSLPYSFDMSAVVDCSNGVSPFMVMVGEPASFSEREDAVRYLEVCDRYNLSNRIAGVALDYLKREGFALDGIPGRYRIQGAVSVVG